MCLRRLVERNSLRRPSASCSSRSPCIDHVRKVPSPECPWVPTICARRTCSTSPRTGIFASARATITTVAFSVRPSQIRRSISPVDDRRESGRLQVKLDAHPVSDLQYRSFGRVGFRGIDEVRGADFARQRGPRRRRLREDDLAGPLARRKMAQAAIPTGPPPRPTLNHPA